MSEIPFEKENNMNFKSRSHSTLQVASKPDMNPFKTSLNLSWSTNRDNKTQTQSQKEDLEHFISTISMDPCITIEEYDGDEKMAFQPSPFKLSKTARTSFLSRSATELPIYRRNDQEEECGYDTEEETSLTPRDIPSRSNIFMQPRSFSFGSESGPDRFRIKRSQTSGSLLISYERPKPVLSPRTSQKIEVTEETALPCFKSNSPQYHCIDGETVCHHITRLKTCNLA